MYKITNISRNLTIFGLFPGKSKTIENIDLNTRKLIHNKLLLAKEIKNNKKLTKKQNNDNITIENIVKEEDYTKEELMMILKRRLEKERMKMTATARQYMTVFIGSLVATEERSHASSRLMRIVADLIVRNCLQRMAKSNRTSTVKEVISVQKQDVAMFTEAFVAGVMNERKRIGFI